MKAHEVVPMIVAEYEDDVAAGRLRFGDGRGERQQSDREFLRHVVII